MRYTELDDRLELRRDRAQFLELGAQRDTRREHETRETLSRWHAESRERVARCFESAGTFRGISAQEAIDTEKQIVPGFHVRQLGARKPIESGEQFLGTAFAPEQRFDQREASRRHPPEDGRTTSVAVDHRLQGTPSVGVLRPVDGRFGVVNAREIAHRRIAELLGDRGGLLEGSGRRVGLAVQERDEPAAVSLEALESTARIVPKERLGSRECLVRSVRFAELGVDEREVRGDLDDVPFDSGSSEKLLGVRKRPLRFFEVVALVVRDSEIVLNRRLLDDRAVATGQFVRSSQFLDGCVQAKSSKSDVAVARAKQNFDTASHLEVLHAAVLDAPQAVEGAFLGSVLLTAKEMDLGELGVDDEEVVHVAIGDGFPLRSMKNTERGVDLPRAVKVDAELLQDADALSSPGDGDIFIAGEGLEYSNSGFVVSASRRDRRRRLRERDPSLAARLAFEIRLEKMGRPLICASLRQELRRSKHQGVAGGLLARGQQVLDDPTAARRVVDGARIRAEPGRETGVKSPREAGVDTPSEPLSPLSVAEAVASLSPSRLADDDLEIEEPA